MLIVIVGVSRLVGFLRYQNSSQIPYNRILEPFLHGPTYLECSSTLSFRIPEKRAFFLVEIPGRYGTWSNKCLKPLKERARTQDHNNTKNQAEEPHVCTRNNLCVPRKSQLGLHNGV